MADKRCESKDKSVRIQIITVVLKDTANVDQVLQQHQGLYGFSPCFVYRYALNGYAAHIDASFLPAIEAEPDVLFVSRDSELGLGPGLQPEASVQSKQPGQSISNGIRRVGGDLSSTASGDGSGSVEINVAVLDTGIQPDHPDLDVASGFNCLTGPDDDFADPDGHGTFVGGLIGAQDNDIGRVGIAPGASLYGVRALDAKEGFGSDAEIVCGLDWVASTRLDADATNDIAVANMSLGGPQLDDQACGVSAKDDVHYAICGIVSLGVVPVAAAGNNAVDFAGDGPATYSEVLTVTAMGDNDGQPGGLGGQFVCVPQQFDDEFAVFSNFATLPEDQAHTVAAPGVCIGSTYIKSVYAIGSGTSFSSPIVAGTVALCITAGPCAGLSPAQVIQKIVADAAAYNNAHPEYGFEGDPLRPVEGKYYGYLIRAALY